ncbi:MAG: galactokinase, partial [Desulfosudaceae bacterium]
PLGLIFAVAAFFNAGGIHIDIDSASPPRSALGGSSVAAVALVAALMAARGKRHDKTDIVLTAHAVEEAVARVPCGYQDQLAAVFGGGNAWEWRFAAGQPVFHQRKVITADRWETLKDCLLLAYCGIPHESRDINGQWIRHFLSGRDRHIWHDIVDCTAAFSQALRAGRLDRAVFLMNREVDLRKEMTPAVFDDMGNLLVEHARDRQCGARFCGAGGGGCVWALGEPGRIRELRKEWQDVLRAREQAELLDARMDTAGLVVETAGQG